MNPMIQGLLGNLNSQAGMQRPMGGLLGMPQGLLGGFHPFQPNFNASMFQRTPYQPQRFAAPNLNPPQQQQAPAAAPAGFSGNPFMGSPISPQAAAQLMAFQMPASYKGMSPQEIAYAMSAGGGP